MCTFFMAVFLVILFILSYDVTKVPRNDSRHYYIHLNHNGVPMRCYVILFDSLTDGENDETHQEIAKCLVSQVALYFLHKACKIASLVDNE